MLCENCGEYEANIKYTQIINGVKKQINLCESCARKYGISDIAFNMPSINFSSFLDGMFDDNFSEFIPSLTKPEIILCDKCKSSFEDFEETGKFGCDECYNVFSNKIDALLKNIHGVNRHVGRNSQKQIHAEPKNQKGPKEEQQTKQTQLEQLKEQLKQEIKEERYESAAKTRDKIKEIKKTIQDGEEK